MTQPSLHKAGTLTVAVLSDLHAYEKAEEDKQPSFYSILSDFETTPVGHLFHLIEKESLKADLLLCGGDLGDKASKAAISEAWKQVHNIGNALETHLVAGTAGNHDMDSRYVNNDFDPREHLVHLAPPFPLPDEDVNDRYWARNFVIQDHDSYRLLVLNSSAYHGSGKEEYRHGRVSDSTLCEIKQKLKSLPSRDVNILLCHHHPQKHMERDLGEYDEMRSGQLLLDLLGDGEFGDWIVIHGHKHHPKLCYSHGGSNAPVIFSAASLCHVLYPRLADVGRQFYLLEFPIDRFDRFGTVATFRSWNWEFGSGWGKASRTANLPALGGFGYRTNLILYANRIFQEVGDGILTWEEFSKRCPEFQYLLPKDARVVERILSRDFGIKIVCEDDNPVQIGAAT